MHTTNTNEVGPEEVHSEDIPPSKLIYLVYTRFEYAYKDLQDCLEHVQDDIANSYTETMYRAMLADLCKRFVEEYDSNLMGFDNSEEEE